MDEKELTRHAILGYQVKLLAHQLAIEEVQAKLAELIAPAHADIVTTIRPRRMGRPPKALLAAVNGTPVRSGWPVDPAERSAEMKRRQAVARANKRKTGAQIRWERATPAQREKWQKAMQAGLRKKKHRERGMDNARKAVEQYRKQQPVVKMEVSA